MSNNRRNFKSNNESKQATAEVIGISLADAYEIVGGYQDADEKTLAVAIQMLENDNSDSEFAMQLIKMYKSGTAFKYAKLEDLSDENLEKGLEKATEFSRTAKDTARETLSDATVNKFIINTPMNDIYGNPVSSVARDEGINLLSRAAEEDTTQQIILGKSTAYKENFFKRLINLRIGSLRKNKEAKLSDAFNPEKTISIDAQAVSDTFDKCKQNAKKFEEKLEKRVEKASSKAKTLYHKYRTYVVAGFMAISSVTFMSSCSNKQERVPTQQEVVDTPINMKQDTVQTQEIRDDSLKVNITPIVELKDSVQNVETDTAQNDTIKTNAFVYVTKEKTGLIDYINKSFPELGYEGAYKKIQENIDKFSGISDNPDVILNAYRFATSAPSWEVKHGEVAKVARELGNWLQPCNGETVEFPQNIDAMFIQQFDGTLDGVRVTGYDNCDDKMMVEKSQTKVKEEVAQETVAEDVAEEVAEEVAETPEFTDADAEVIGERDNTTKVQKSLNITEHNGNENLTDGKQVKENVSESEANRDVKGADKRKVLVQNNGTNTKAATFADAEAVVLATDSTSNNQIKATELNGNQNLTSGKVTGSVDLTNVSVNTGDSKVLTENSDTVTVKKKKAANLRKEQAKKEARAAKLAAQADSVAAPLFANAEAEIFNAADTVKVKADVAAPAAPLFAEGEAEIFNPADTVQVKKEQADVKLAEEEVSNEAPINGGDTEEIIFGTENAPLGTPSAFDTPERGGFEGSGITEKADKHNRKVLGDELYDLIVNGTPDHWFNNGNLAGGLSRRQLASVVAVMVVTGPHQETTQELLDAINCQREIRAELFDKVKADIDGIRENRTRDGWTYDKPVYVRKVKNNGCEKKVTLDKVRAENRKKTTASGPKFPRLFKLIKPFVPAFTMGEAEIIGVRENVDTIQAALVINELNGNEGLTDPKVIKTGVPVEEAMRNVKDADKHKVLVQDKKADGFIAQELNGNEGLTDGKNLGEVELDGNIQAQNKDSKVLVAGKKTQTKKGQKKHLTFKIFKQKKAYAAKMAKKKAKQKADEGNAALMAWAEKLK